MSYSNGRVYRELVSGQIRSVSVYDVMQALGTDINNVGGLCRLGSINPWAKFHPIPCAQAANNKPIPLTRAQRMSERYGVDPPVDMFTADDVQAYENYANQISQHGAYYIKMRPWGDTHFKRLDDFADNASYNVGYDHFAQPDNKKVIIRSGTSYQVGEHYLAPLIPEGQRQLYIPAGSTNARFMFPVDHCWMDVYYAYEYGTTSLVVEVQGNNEWLSPMDFMGNSTYSISYASVIRRILIFRWEDSQRRTEGDSVFDADNAQWHFYNYATDKILSSSAVWNSTDRPFSSYPQAWLDLTDSETAVNTASNLGERRLKDLAGRCLFIDCWLQSNSSVNLFPILGYAYEVTISRTTDIGVDISGLITFDSVYRDSSGGYYYYVLYIDYAPEPLNLDSGVSDWTVITNKLKEYYDSISINIGGNIIDLYRTSPSRLEYETSSDGHGDWFRIECSVYSESQQSSLQPTDATVIAVKKNSGFNSYKDIPISEQ